MKKALHRAGSRGHANHGWLDSHHTFSFAGYQNPDRMQFGMLRVLNDDIVTGGAGFGKHPHNNMEIVSIPLSGNLKHEDSMGHSSVIKTNDVQIMSAGTGIVHSEFNPDGNNKVNFLQIWIFPKADNINPRYGQKTYRPSDRLNKIQTVVSPHESDQTLWINQDAYFSLGNFEKGFTSTYELKNRVHGVYVFNISGNIQIADENLNSRDGIGLWDTDKFDITAKDKAEILFIEVPMD